MDKMIIKAKRIECIIGIILLFPPILGVLAFILQLFDADTDFSRLSNLGSYWTARFDAGGGMSAAPIYLGLMAIAGGYLIKDSLYSFFEETNKTEEPNK